MNKERLVREILYRLKTQGLPSHEQERKDGVKPGFREVTGDERVLITLDGPCASGKTTLARKLAQAFGGAVVHTDDFVIPHNQKTVERLAVPGGNCDAERLVHEVAAPFKNGCPVRYRRYDCMTDTLLPEELLPPVRVLILEGSYCNLPEIRKYADVRLFLDAPWEVRKARLLERESPDSMRQFLNRWIPLENAYFAAFHLPDEGCVTIDGGDIVF